MEFAPTEYNALYSFIGRCLLLELDAASVEMLRAPEMSAALSKLDPQLDAYLDREWTADDFDDAAAEYCALFVLPRGVTQNASYWIPGDTAEVGHKLVAGVHQVLNNFELSVEELPMGNVPHDNVGLLLLLAAHLYEVDETSSSSSTHGDDFVANFVSPWGPAFSAALLGKTQNPVYRAVGHLLAQTVPATA